MRALITTTINVPGNLELWRRALAPDDVVIVAGDLQSPHDDIEAFLGDLPGVNRYLHPKAQVDWAVSDVIGWRCVQRRNVALLEALRYDPEFIITVDDDNYPLDSSHVDHYASIFNGTATRPQLAKSSTGWFNPGIMCFPPVTHRGMPLDQRGNHDGYVEFTAQYAPCRVAVAASLWIGHPDVDAIERLHVGQGGPVVQNVRGGDVVLGCDTWAPFNSQATAFITELAPALLMWPHVGRYDDIWASYLTRVVTDLKGWSVYYGRPLVRQIRNEHNLLRDFDAERFGMEHTPRLVRRLRNIYTDLRAESASGWSVTKIVDAIFAQLQFKEWIPSETKLAWAAWLIDLQRARETVIK